ncbi:SH3 domain-containing protein [Pararhodobacter oceanensis]|uniref:SH3 domain-containing protein n=1 Tax=Pararhodobacter oceanensis TaxID=2172121 RepID=UPI003A8FEFFC
MLRILITIAALCFAGIATAQEFPAVHRVTDVANHDVLNIRAEPSARADIVGSFGPYETGIEVVGLSPDRRWGLVRSGEGVGWSSMRYLTPQRTGSWQDGTQHLTCFGTEPFWSFNLFMPSNRAEFEDLGMGGFEVRSNAPHHNITRHPATMALRFNGARQGFAVIRQGVCSDGMSDRLFGLETQIYWQGAREGFSGCCTLTP